MQEFLPYILPALGILILIVAAISFSKQYKTVSADEAMIVTGGMLGSKNVISSDPENPTARKVKIVSSGGTFLIPIFQRGEKISLKTHKIDFTTTEVYTSEGVPVIADAVAIVKVGSTTEDIFGAAERYLGKSDEEIRTEAREVLEGHLRSILGTLTVEDSYKNRDKFGQSVQQISGKDLSRMGLVIDSFVIKDVRDKNGYLAALGKPRIAQVKRDAEIAEATASKEATIERAKANEEAEKAELVKETNVAEAQKDRDMKTAEFKRQSDRANAEAAVAYQIQEALSKQEVIEANMRAQQIQKERDIELEEKEAIRMQKHLEATVHKQADAELYRRTQDAEAQRIEQETKAKADAEMVRTKAAADAESQRVKAEAQAEATKREGTAKAEVVRLQGVAEAEAKKAQTEIVRAQGENEAAAEKARIENLSAEGTATAAAIEAKGLAEAKVAEAKAQADIIREKGLAEAKLALGQILILEELIKSMPEIAGKIAEPMASIDKLTVIDTGNGENGGAMGKITNHVTNLMTFLPEVVKNLSGVDLSNVLANLSKGRLSGENNSEAHGLGGLLKSLEGVNPATLEALAGSGVVQNLLSGNKGEATESDSNAK